MTDDQLDQVVRDADPYGPGVVARLHGADQILLEEIMSSERVAAPWRRRVLTAVAAAAAVTAVLAVSITARNHTADTRQAAPSVTGSAAAGKYSEFVLKAAEQNPRLLIGQPGWKVSSVYGFADDNGEIRFVNGKRELEMNWYPAGQYQGYYESRLNVSKPQPGKIDGWTGDVFTYSSSDFALMLKPRDNSFVELRTGGTWTRSDFDAVLTHVTKVDVPTWLAALPPEIVTPAKIDEAADRILTGVPLPPKFDRSSLAALGTNDAYQFGAAVIGRVGCGWIAEYERADKAGEKGAVAKAAAALRGSHQWKVLHDMESKGAYSQVFWEYADRIAGGGSTQGYRDALGCP